MRLIAVYAHIYGRALTRAVTSVKRSPWTLLLPVVVWTGMLLAQTFVSGLGFLSGIASALALSALFSSYLYFVGELVSEARVSVAELGKSFGSYFWAVINVGFVVWVVEWLMSLALARSRQAAAIMIIVRFAEFVLLNAAPEVIYLRRTYGGMATVQRTITFVQANWIEWFIPNLAFGAAFWWGVPFLAQIGIPTPVIGVVIGALFHLIMVFRGFLFEALDSTSHRQRMYRYSATSDS
jgi:hypothetical protein